MEKIKHTSGLIIILMASILLSKCSSADTVATSSNMDFNGSTQSIRNYTTPQLLSIMVTMGLHINPGNSPPIINGNYLASRLRLYASNIPNDQINSIFADTAFKFENQNRQKLVVDLSYITANGSEFSRGNSAVVSGNANRFSIFAKQIITEDFGTAESIIVISGESTESGIIDFQFALFILDNHGVSDFIANNHGRLFYDADGLAERQE